VRARTAAVPSPAEVAQAGRDAHAQALSAVARLDAPDPEAGPGGPTIAIGWGDAIASVNQFVPATVTVPAGTTVS